MKTELTIEQSQYLIGLGVPKEKASKTAYSRITDPKGDPIPKKAQPHGIMDKPFAAMHVGFETFKLDDVFTITDLLKILPKEIEYEEYLSEFTMQWNSTYQCWDVGYVYSGGFWKRCRFRYAELIDALYELTVWCIENKHLKFE